MRIVRAPEAVAWIDPGDQVYLHCAAATPSVLLDALVARAPELHDVGVVHLHCEGPGPHLAPEMARPLPASRPVHRAERPSRRQRGPRGLRAGLPLGRPAAVRLGCAAARRGLRQRDAARRHGFCSLGTSVEAMHAAIRAAKTVIVQFNRAMPRTLGESFIHVNDIDLAVEVDVPPYEHRDRRDRRRRAADRRARRGSGPGRRHAPARASGPSRRPSALALGDKRDLGIHTEMFTDAVVDLVEAGVVTGARKERNRGKIVTAFMMGTQRLYDFVHDNPMVEMRRGRLHQRHPCHPLVQPDGRDQLGDRGGPDRPGRRRLDRPSPLQRRRWADGLHPRRGPGGEGRAIIALPSTAAGGTRSRITATPRAGRRRRHDPSARADRRHRVGRRGAVRAERARSGPRAHRDRPPGLSRPVACRRPMDPREDCGLAAARTVRVTFGLWA